MGNVDLGRAIYLGLPYYVRWLLAVVRVLVEKHHIGLSELAEALDRLWDDRALARALGRAARARYDEMGIGWRKVLSCLLA